MPLELEKRICDDTTLGLWRVEESIDELRQHLQLNEEEEHFYQTLKKNKRNLHWLSSRVLLRKLLHTDEFIEVGSTGKGKPILINFDYELSISHSFDYAAVIISKNKVGVDIERMGEKIRIIRDRFLSKEEIAGMKNPDDLRELYIYWGIKESMYKLEGKGDLNFKKHLIVSPFDPSNEGDAACMIHKNGESRILKGHYFILGNYVLTWAVDEVPEYIALS